MSNDWYYLNGEEQIGPYPGEQLHELINGGHIQRDTLLWTEGMGEWLPAEQIENLFPAEVEPVASPAAATPVLVTGATAAAAPDPALYESTNPYGVQSVGANEDWEGNSEGRKFPFVSTTKASFKKYLTFAIFIPLICLAIFFLLAATVSAQEIDSTDVPELAGWQLVLTIALPVIASISLFIGWILGLMVLHKAWRMIQTTGQARTSPGAAVGCLFIPFFNLYWIFVAYRGFAVDWNQILPTYSDTQDAPMLNTGIFFSYCLSLLILGIAGPIFYIWVIFEMCKAINYMSSRAATQAAQPGGTLRLY